MRTGSNIFATTTGIVVTGLLFGVLAVLLQQAGNPGNMGICVVCFNRDIAGAIGLHRAAVVQYLRPEIMGMVLGAFGAALLFGEYKPRGGSAPITRFLLGAVAGIGALVFLGCPWRVILRLAAATRTPCSAWPGSSSVWAWARSSSARAFPWAAAKARTPSPAWFCPPSCWGSRPWPWPTRK